MVTAGGKKKAKASESRTMLLFVVDLCEEFVEYLGEPGKFLVKAGRALLHWYQVVRDEDRALGARSKVP
jgi:hypothetical protein